MSRETAKTDEEAVALANETLWDAKDVARYLKVSRSWVYHQSEAGVLPCLRFGPLVRFEPEVIRRHAREVGSVTKRPHHLPLTPRALRKGV